MSETATIQVTSQEQWSIQRDKWGVRVVCKEDEREVVVATLQGGVHPSMPYSIYQPRIDAMANAIADVPKLMGQVAELTRELESVRAERLRMETERDRYAEAVEHQKYLLAEEKRRMVVYKDAVAGNYWIWQGDGEDHLESLTCNVQIRPEQLLEITAQLTALRTAT